MKFISSASIAVIVGLLVVTPAVTAIPRQLALEDMEVVNVDSLINELDNDVLLRDDIFGAGGKETLISKLVGGGYKGAIADQVVHSFLNKFGDQLGVDLAGLVDAIINTNGPDTQAVLDALKKSKKFIPLSKILESFGGAPEIDRVVESVKKLLGSRLKHKA
ncbi:hypothetical protein K7432_006406 [Basidiobolus ranarum]|uniref:Uncharacterized protein n=1 Tax=Basidiobolus ranarum TaxID=34480 RepID=A0ABR2WUX4_9FUNG